MESYSDLQKLLEVYMRQEDIEFIHSVYLFAKNAHEGQMRKSGDPYIIHPIAVAAILAERKLDSRVIAAALLHDVVEDTDCTSDVINDLFGEDIAKIVEGVTKLGNIKGYSLDERQAENHRKLILSAAEDTRVLLVKLADRMHNIKTLGFMNESKQKIIANETLEVYAPIAHRLGMYKMKWELEDMSFKVVNPTEYNRIAKKLQLKREERDDIVKKEVERLHELFAVSNVDVTITGRSKHIYSIYRKITEKGQIFEELTDLFAFRIVTKSIADCYSVLGVLHENYKPIPMRFKDYIPTPKHNMYQSIHTTVIAADSIPIEVQIRTGDMDEVAEYGIAAHWLYKNSNDTDSIHKSMQNKLSWLTDAKSLEGEGLDSIEFMDRIQADHFSKSIFVYTPQGDMIELPENSTVLDFAFYIHSELGFQALSAQVNNKVVSLFYKLSIGDVVSVVTTKNSKPEVDWIRKVKTTRAKDALKKYFKNDQKRIIRNEGRRLLLNYFLEVEDVNMKEILDSDRIYPLAEKFGIGTRDDFLYEVGIGEIELTAIKKHILKQNDNVVVSRLPEVIIEDAIEPKTFIFCKRCSPIPGDEIKAIRANDKYTNRYVIHRNECYQPFKLNAAHWTDNAYQRSYKVRLLIEFKDKIGGIGQIVGAIVKNNINITSVYARGEFAGLGLCRVSIEVNSSDELKQVIASIRESNDVVKVERRIDEEQYENN
ncbi:RelA/SpoT family protein [Mollicutes bacterium LVI A0039]|nr:RelA/SpoT family protein [Mollicutes bacterium LVI A0039]